MKLIVNELNNGTKETAEQRAERIRASRRMYSQGFRNKKRYNRKRDKRNYERV